MVSEGVMNRLNTGCRFVRPFPLPPVFLQVEDWDPFIDTLDYIFHTAGVKATKVRQYNGACPTCFLESINPWRECFGQKPSMRSLRYHRSRLM